MRKSIRRIKSKMKRTTMPLSKTRKLVARRHTRAYYDCTDDSVGHCAATTGGIVGDDVQGCKMTRWHTGDGDKCDGF